MLSAHKSVNRMSVARQIIITTLVALVVAISLSGTGSATAAQKGQISTKDNTTTTTTATSPQAVCPAGGQCFADVPSGNPFYEFVNRIYTQDLVTGYACGGPGEPCDAESRPYYRPATNVTRQQMAKFIDNARRLPQIFINSPSERYPAYIGSSAPDSVGVLGFGNFAGIEGQVGDPDAYGVYAEQDTNDPNATGAAIRASATTANGITSSSLSGDALIAQSTSGYGVYGSSTSYVGIRGSSQTGTGILGGSNSGLGVGGSSSTNYGVRGSSSSNDGVHGDSTSGTGVYGTSSTGLAGEFDGNVTVSGTCCAASEGTYRIDDPTDPTNKYLYHSAVQSSSMLDLYTGHVTLDANGTAWVTMPSWFQALNTDFDYQLTCIGGFANVYIASEIQDNRFQIAGGTPNLKVSWQVTGTRHDPYAEQNPVPTQQDKPASEKGTYLHPELYTQPANK